MMNMPMMMLSMRMFNFCARDRRYFTISQLG